MNTESKVRVVGVCAQPCELSGKLQLVLRLMQYRRSAVASSLDVFSVEMGQEEGSCNARKTVHIFFSREWQKEVKHDSAHIGDVVCSKVHRCASFDSFFAQLSGYSRKSHPSEPSLYGTDSRSRLAIVEMECRAQTHAKMHIKCSHFSPDSPVLALEYYCTVPVQEQPKCLLCERSGK